VSASVVDVVVVDREEGEKELAAAAAATSGESKEKSVRCCTNEPTGCKSKQ
jgi:hypothetical protein